MNRAKRGLSKGRKKPISNFGMRKYESFDADIAKVRQLLNVDSNSVAIRILINQFLSENEN